MDEPTAPPAGPQVGFAVDTYQLVLLSRGVKAGELDQARIDELGDAHIRHNLMMQADGRLLAAGAVVGATTELVQFMCPKGTLSFHNTAAALLDAVPTQQQP